MVTPAMRTTAVLTSGLASDSDKFKIIIAGCKSLEIWDPTKNFNFLFNPLMVKF